MCTKCRKDMGVRAPEAETLPTVKVIQIPIIKCLLLFLSLHIKLYALPTRNLR